MSAYSVRRFFILAATAVASVAVSTIPAIPAHAAGPVGYVRLAHLSPDTPKVNVYVTPVGSSKSQEFPGVGYGVFSTYLTVPTGTYAVSMKNPKLPQSAPAILTTNVTVAAGKAYTVAGVGRKAALGLKVFQDDLTPPPAGQAKIRVIQASVRAPVMDVGVLNGPSIVDSIPFATTTKYYTVDPGRWTLHCVGTNDGPATHLAVHLRAGAVYTLLVLDQKHSGITSELRVDAGSRGAIPVGGVQTGAGGTAPRPVNPLAVGLAVFAVVLGGGLVLVRRHRRPAVP